jgi:hypothetical protein
LNRELGVEAERLRRVFEQCFLDARAQTFFAARSSCQARGNGWDLASVRSAEVSAFLGAAITFEGWLLASDVASEGNWVWLDDGATSTDTIDAGSAQVLAVNVATGEITVDAAANLPSLAAGRNIFRLGDFNGNSGNVLMKGVQAFITASDSPAALWGVTAAQRAVHPQRWAGCRLPSSIYSSKGTEERLRILGAWMTGRFKGKGPSAVYINPEDHVLLESQMIARG